MDRSRSGALFTRAKRVIPGGVNSPVRTFRGVGGNPVFIAGAVGAILYDADHNEYIDYLGSWGPMLFGHAWEPIVQAVTEQLQASSSYGLASEKEVVLAELIVDLVPGAEQVRLVNSGTEACMTALRIARAFTGRQKLIKFDGCYHGHADPFLVNAGSGALTLGVPSSAGVDKQLAQHTLTAAYNDLDGVENLLLLYPGEVAAIIVEPVAGNMGCVLPKPGFLPGLRKLADKYGLLLIFDEVMTGFRLAAGGAQQLYGVEADLVTYGKIVGGGFPVGAVAGKRNLMELLAPCGAVYQAGTLSGNPVATTAGISMLSHIKNNPHIYQQLDGQASKLANGLLAIFQQKGIPVQVNRVGSMLSLFFAEEEVCNFDDAKNSDVARFAQFFGAMLNEGVHLPPSAFEAWFLGTSHTSDLIAYTLGAVEKSVRTII